MELMNERNQVRTVADRWRAHYGGGTYFSDSRGRMVGKELAEMNKETATEAQVAEIIGNGSWVRENVCHECGVTTWDAVEIGEPHDFESRTATICGACLRAALKLLGDAA